MITDEIISDIIEQLQIPDAEVVHTGFYRQNISLDVIPVVGDPDKEQRIKQALQNDGPGIIYAATTATVDRIAAELDGSGWKVAAYHGRMSAKRRQESQDRFMSGAAEVMVATNAFGLGIDKPDIRFVMHYHLTGSLEAYYQEVGRAGRDGLPSRAVAFYDPADTKLLRFLQGSAFPDDSDLVNAYHAIELATANKKPTTAADLHQLSPLPKNRMKVCLALFESKGVIVQEKRGHYRLARADLSREQLEMIALNDRLRAERNVIRQQHMREFAETTQCRWDYMLRYFDDSPLVESKCGHCGNCIPDTLFPSEI